MNPRPIAYETSLKPVKTERIHLYFKAIPRFFVPLMRYYSAHQFTGKTRYFRAKSDDARNARKSGVDCPVRSSYFS